MNTTSTVKRYNFAATSTHFGGKTELLPVLTCNIYQLVPPIHFFSNTTIHGHARGLLHGSGEMVGLLGQVSIDAADHRRVTVAHQLRERPRYRLRSKCRKCQMRDEFRIQRDYPEVELLAQLRVCNPPRWMSTFSVAVHETYLDIDLRRKNRTSRLIPAGGE